MSLLSRYRVWIMYALPATVIAAPWVAPGFILTLDMVFTPTLRLPESVGHDYPLYAVLYLLNSILPADFIQKILLFIIFVLMGVGAHRLMGSLRPTVTDASIWRSSSLIAGLFYMANPFVYDRLMAGQWAILFGYALVPFVLRAAWSFSARPSAKSAAGLAAWLIVVSIVSLHMFVIATLIMLAFVVQQFVARRGDRRWLRSMALWMAGVVIMFTVISSYWLIPLLMGQGMTAQALDTFSSSPSEAFATVGGHELGKVANVIRLQGFWAEQQGLFELPQQHMAAWGALFLLWWTLVAAGIIWWFRRSRSMAFMLVCLTITGIVLATGVWQQWLGSHVPLFAGFREPQKFAAIIALIFALAGGAGVAVLIEKWETHVVAMVSASALIVGISPVLWFGAAGQLVPRQYPADWYAANEILNRSSPGGSALFLPWHNYMSFDFAGRIIGNPAQQFFDRQTVMSNDPEFKDARPVRRDTLAEQVGAILMAGDTNLAGRLVRHNIVFIILAKDLDYRRYDYLDGVKQFRVIHDSKNIKVYKNEAYAK